MADHIPAVIQRQPRQFRRLQLQTTNLREDEIRRRYRFCKDNIERLTQLIRHRLEHPTKRNQPLTPEIQVMITLRFYATGAFLQVIGDTFGVDIATVSRTITKVTEAILELRDRFIIFPTLDADKNKAKGAFYRMHGFPSIISCIDGTHVRIQAPGQPDEPNYINRKHYHSINVQASCDHRGIFTSINACWPGASHDSHVFRTSNLCQHLEAHHQDPENGVLLGDSGYPCRPFLLTPYLNPRNAQEEHYNRAHMSTRNLIERVFGVWKRRFHVLHAEIRMKPGKCSKIITACAILHNLAIMWAEPMDLDGEDIDQPLMEAYEGRIDGKGVRDHIANTYFR